jgi:hypothetical protein
MSKEEERQKLDGSRARAPVRARKKKNFQYPFLSSAKADVVCNEGLPLEEQRARLVGGETKTVEVG